MNANETTSECVWTDEKQANYIKQTKAILAKLLRENVDEYDILDPDSREIAIGCVELLRDEIIALCEAAT
jgi:hypothetical protein